jgi:putative dimethyl sulfoxide reductase chaperone
VSVAAELRAVDRASAARLLASWWSRPTPEERARWARVWEPAGELVDLLDCPSEVLEELQEAAEESDPGALLEEYERLLVGPGRAPCPPYESLWRTDAPRREQGRLMGSFAADAVRIYGELGLRLRPEAHELPDHVVVEWEALAHAFEHDAAGAVSALASDHLSVWMPGFCAAVGAETGEPFYAVLALLTPAWTTALAA